MRGYVVASGLRECLGIEDHPGCRAWWPRQPPHQQLQGDRAVFEVQGWVDQGYFVFDRGSSHSWATSPTRFPYRDTRLHWLHLKHFFKKIIKNNLQCGCANVFSSGCWRWWWQRVRGWQSLACLRNPRGLKAKQWGAYVPLWKCYTVLECCSHVMFSKFPKVAIPFSSPKVW